MANKDLTNDSGSGSNQIGLLPLWMPQQTRKHPVLEMLRQLLPIFFLLACMPLALRSVLGQRVLLSATILLALYTTRAYTTGVVLAITYLAFMGGLRRWLILIHGWPGNDPLILIVPLFLGLVFIQKAFQKQIPKDTPIAKMVFWLLIIMCIQIFNPMQGGIQIGLAGAIYYVVPLLWYYFGREAGNSTTISSLFGAVVCIGILAALYGLYQTFFGFTSFEETWIKESGYGALNVGRGQIRAISFFTSAAEYDLFLVIGVIILWAYWLRGHFLAILPIPLLATAIFLETGRGPVVYTLFACMIMWAVKGKDPRFWAPRIVVAIVLGSMGLFWSLKQVQEVHQGERTSLLVEHQTQGLLDPFNQKTSTVGVHASLLSGGFMGSLATPLGRGLGSTTAAAGKYGGEGGGTEVDYTDMLVSLGLFGGVLYIVFIGVVLKQAFGFWHRQRDPIALATLGILLAQLGHWLHGGQYSTCMIICFSIGAMDRTWRQWKEQTLREQALREQLLQEQLLQEQLLHEQLPDRQFPNSFQKEELREADAGDT